MAKYIRAYGPTTKGIMPGVTIEPTIKVTMSRQEARKYVYFTVQALEIEKTEGSPFRTESYMLGSGNRSQKLEDMPRLNRKRMDLIWSAIEQMVDTQTGPVWAAVEDVLREKGWSLTPEPVAV